MYFKSSLCLGVFLLTVLTPGETEANSSACEQKEKHDALLDLAKDSIKKVKDLHPACENDNKDASSNSSECGAKEKISALLDITKNLIEQAKNNYTTCEVTTIVTDVVVSLHKRPADCSEVLENGEDQSGVYTIWPRHRIMKGRSVDVYCDMHTDGGGWTVIQRRMWYVNQTDFYRDWKNYKRGFGNIKEEFWLGNDNIFALTNQAEYSLRFDMVKKVNFSRDSRFAVYSSFWIEDESADYTLHIGSYNGTAGDGIRDADNIKFSTKDRRNDVAKHVCTEQKRGGWWYKDCSRSNPNGVLLPDGLNDHSYVNWYPFTNYDSLFYIDMKIKRSE